MNEYLQKFRAQYPEYGDMSDADLAKALHAKFYADMSYPEFADKIGLGQSAAVKKTWDEKLAENNQRMGLGGGSLREFADVAAPIAMSGLGTAVQAIRTARALPMTSSGPLPVEYGQAAPLLTPARRTAMDALRGLVKSPVVKGAIGGGLGYDALRRLLSGGQH